jgi:hypothetical protein
MVGTDTNPHTLVYRYLYWDEETRVHKTSSTYATLPAIHTGLGIPIYGSARYVSVKELQAGIHTPRLPSLR